MQLRDYQKKVITDTYNWFRQGKKSVLVFSPTGSGKTLIAAQLIADAIKKGRRVLFCCHRKKLIGQTQKTIKEITGIDAGLIVPSVKENFNSPVQIGMLQTIASRFKKKGFEGLPKDVGLLILDEAHVSSSFDVVQELIKNYSGGILACGKLFVVGLSATPWRTNKKEGFCQYYQCVVKAPSPRQLINQGYLTNPRIFHDLYKESGLDTSSLEIDKATGDYSASSLIRACNHEYNKNVISKYLNVTRDKKAIAFCAGIEQAKDMVAQFTELDIPSKLIIGSTPDKERDQIFEDFRLGKIHVLTSVSTLTEGFDDPTIEACIIARPTRSPALLIQMVGRALRLNEGKDTAYILDFGGCIDWITDKKFGNQRVTDPIDLDYVPLCPDTKPPKEMDTKECPVCEATEIPQFARVCPHCGHEFGKENKAIEKELEFPEFTEFMTTEAKKQYRWLRDFMRRSFSKQKNPSDIFEKFVEKWGMMPPKEWFLGSIFSLKHPTENAKIYVDTLKRSGINADETIKFILSLEFGIPGKSYVLSSGERYTSPDLRLDRFDWSDYLGVDKFAPANEIKKAYISKVNTAQGEILNYAYDVAIKVRGNKY